MKELASGCFESNDKVWRIEIGAQHGKLYLNIPRLLEKLTIQDTPGGREVTTSICREIARHIAIIHGSMWNEEEVSFILSGAMLRKLIGRLDG